MLGCNFIELSWRNLEVTMGNLKAKGGAAGFCCCIVKRSACNIANPQRTHELQAREPI